MYKHERDTAIRQLEEIAKQGYYYNKFQVDALCDKYGLIPEIIHAGLREYIRKEECEKWKSIQVASLGYSLLSY